MSVDAGGAALLPASSPGFFHRLFETVKESRFLI
jgi:hypothetical protein